MHAGNFCSAVLTTQPQEAASIKQAIGTACNKHQTALPAVHIKTAQVQGLHRGTSSCNMQRVLAQARLMLANTMLLRLQALTHGLVSMALSFWTI